MKTILIFDVHWDLDAVKKIVANADPKDKLVFLGDLCDSRKFNVDMNFIYEFFSYMIDLDIKYDCQWILGNHDIQYMIPIKANNGFICSGYSNETRYAINAVVPRKFFSKFKLFTVLTYPNKQWIVSHAGMHRHHFIHPIKGFDLDYISGMCKDVFDDAFNLGLTDPILGAGTARQGRYPYGGINWLDWNWEFTPIEDINQIVGHTAGDEPRMIVSKELNSENFCGDCKQTVYATIDENGAIAFYNLDGSKIDDSKIEVVEM